MNRARDAHAAPADFRFAHLVESEALGIRHRLIWAQTGASSLTS